MIGSLLEYLIYASVLAILMTASLQYVVGIHLKVLNAQQSLSCLMQEISIQTILTKDLCQAYTQVKQYNNTSEEGEFVWQTTNYFIGWTCKAGNLYRRQGTFNNTTQTWHEGKKSLIGQNITHFSIHPQEKDASRYICSYEDSKGSPTSWVVSLRNRVVT